jgi:hypothetical protein
MIVSVYVFSLIFFLSFDGMDESKLVFSDCYQFGLITFKVSTQHFKNPSFSAFFLINSSPFINLFLHYGSSIIRNDKWTFISRWCCCCYHCWVNYQMLHEKIYEINLLFPVYPLVVRHMLQDRFVDICVG